MGAERPGRTADARPTERGTTSRSPRRPPSEVTLRMPKLKGVRFTTAFIERYWHLETSAGEAMIETCPAGVPAGQIEDMSEMLWDSNVSAAIVSNLNEKAFASVEG